MGDRVDHVGKVSKSCTVCKQHKVIDEFYLVKHWSNGRYYRHAHCKTCDYAKRKKHNENNVEHNKWRDIKRRYGVTQPVWEAKFEEQGRCCAICKRTEPDTSRGWSTEHNHVTGKFRGITCAACNLVIGHAKDNIEILKAAIEYLENNEED